MLRDYEGTSLDALRAMVDMGMGAAFLPGLHIASALDPESEGVVAVSFCAGRVARTLRLVCRAGTPDPAPYERLAEILQDVARTHLADALAP